MRALGRASSPDYVTWVLGLGREGIEGRDRAVTSGHLEAHWVERLGSGSLLPKLSLAHVIRDGVFKMLATGRLVLKNLAVRVFPEALLKPGVASRAARAHFPPSVCLMAVSQVPSCS